MPKVPASKAHGLIDELNFIAKSGSVDELRLRRIFNEAKKLNELEDRYMITGICHCLNGNASEAFSNLDAAYSIMPDYVLDAYIKTALNLNLENKAYRKALGAAQEAFPASVSINAIRVLINCGDFTSAKKAIEIYKKSYSNQDEYINALEENSHFNVEVIKGMAEMDFDYKYLSLITRNIMEFAFSEYSLTVAVKKVEIIRDDIDVISNALGFPGASQKQLRQIDDFVLEQLIEYESSTDTQRFVFHISSQEDPFQNESMASYA